MCERCQISKDQGCLQSITNVYKVLVITLPLLQGTGFVVCHKNAGYFLSIIELLKLVG